MDTPAPPPRYRVVRITLIGTGGELSARLNAMAGEGYHLQIGYGHAGDPPSFAIFERCDRGARIEYCACAPYVYARGTLGAQDDAADAEIRLNELAAGGWRLVGQLDAWLVFERPVESG